MSLKKLQDRAKELGIKDVENLNEQQLKDAIAAAESEIAKNEKWNQLVLTAESIGIENAKELSNEELEIAILAHENTSLTEKLNVVAEALGIDTNLSADEISDVIKEKLASFMKVEAEEVKAPEGKTTELFTSQDGNSYGFTEKAPASFRFAGVVKTQTDWLQDKDSMELMIAGNLSYVERKKNK